MSKETKRQPSPVLFRRSSLAIIIAALYLTSDRLSRIVKQYLGGLTGSDRDHPKSWAAEEPVAPGLP